MRTISLNPNGPVPLLSPDQGQTLRCLQRRFGTQAIGRLSPEPPAVISTGFPALDEALGLGGLPRGRIIDIFGPEGSGKTTLCLHVIAQAQRLGGQALFIDADHGLDLTWARRCGVDIGALYVSQPDSAEAALEIVMGMVRAGVSVIVVDSAAALTPEAEIESGLDEPQPGLMAGLLSRALRRLVGPLRRQQSLLLFTNQLRCRIAGADGAETPTGGRALRHYASVQLALQPRRAIRHNGIIVGRRIRATVSKSKVAAPHRWADLDLWRGEAA